jgi:1,4-dihydroxy-2-naphthoate octaprenyltransferase
MALKHYLLEILEPPLLFGLLACLLGVFAAMRYGSFVLTTSILAVVGIILAHISVNLIDDYVDYRSGLDKDTEMTKFSGGSHNLKKGLVNAENLLRIGIVAFVLALIIGAYLIYTNNILIVFAIVGAIAVLFYAGYLTKIPFFSEPLTALCFALMSFGTFIASGGDLGSLSLLAFAAVPAGLQVGIALLVNGIPDRIPDQKHGGRSAVVMLKSNRGAAALYLFFEFICYFLLLVGVLLGFLPSAVLATFLVIPIILAIAKYGISNYKNPQSFERYMAMAALTEWATMLIIVISFI